MKENDVLKKASAAVVAAAALSLAFAPAALADGGHYWKNGPLLVLLNGNNANGTIGVCGNNIGVLGGAVPINSPSFTETCAAGGIVDEG